MKPFIKWAGGKTQLLAEIDEYLPYPLSLRYIEPFLGGGAVLLYLLEHYDFERALAADANPRLVYTWDAVKRHPERVAFFIEYMQKEFAALPEMKDRERYYYFTRREFNAFDLVGRTPIEQAHFAAMFIFLNKTCYNGLYRVNHIGEFNVPFGQHEEFNFDIANLLEVSEAIQPVEFLHMDFERTTKYAGQDTFFYIDPPYLIDGFTGYTGEFGLEDHSRLARFCRTLNKVGATFLLSNADSPTVRELYTGFRIATVQARRAINRDGSGRGRVAEVLVRNYPLDGEKKTVSPVSRPAASPLVSPLGG